MIYVLSSVFSFIFLNILAWSIPFYFWGYTTFSISCWILGYFYFIHPLIKRKKWLNQNLKFYIANGYYPNPKEMEINGFYHYVGFDKNNKTILAMYYKQKKHDLIKFQEIDYFKIEKLTHKCASIAIFTFNESQPLIEFLIDSPKFEWWESRLNLLLNKRD